MQDAEFVLNTNPNQGKQETERCYMENLHGFARLVNEAAAMRSHMKIGEVVQHPDGYPVKIVDGMYLDPIYGRVTNWWSWRRVNPDGTLGETQRGYGW